MANNIRAKVLGLGILWLIGSEVDLRTRNN